MPTARHSLGIAVVNDTVYVIGGGSTNLNVRYYDENEKYTPIGYIPEFSSWVVMPLFMTGALLVIAVYNKKLTKKQNQ